MKLYNPTFDFELSKINFREIYKRIKYTKDQIKMYKREPNKKSNF